MVRGGREEGSGRETRVYLWQIHVDIRQNQYDIVNLKNKGKKKKTFNIMLQEFLALLRYQHRIPANPQMPSMSTGSLCFLVSLTQVP